EELLAGVDRGPRLHRGAARASRVGRNSTEELLAGADSSSTPALLALALHLEHHVGVGARVRERHRGLPLLELLAGEGGEAGRHALPGGAAERGEHRGLDEVGLAPVHAGLLGLPLGAAQEFDGAARRTRLAGAAPGGAVGALGRAARAAAGAE